MGIVLSWLRFLLEELERLKTRKREIEKELENVVPKDSLIFTIPGIGKTLGCIILARVGDVRRFSDKKGLLLIVVSILLLSLVVRVLSQGVFLKKVMLF